MDPQVGKSAVDRRTFLTVREFLWYNCSAVCGSSAQQLYGGVNGDLLQENLYHKLFVPGLQWPEALSPRRPLLTVSLPETLKTQRQAWLTLCGVSFFGGIQHSPVNGCSAASCNLGVLTGEDENIFYSQLLNYFTLEFPFPEDLPILWIEPRSCEL